MRPLAIILLVCVLLAGCGDSHRGGVPYKRAVFNVRAVRATFSSLRLPLVVRGRDGWVTTLQTRDSAVTVDVFGDPQRVAATSFRDLTTYGRSCTSSSHLAGGWNENVRVLVSCSARHSTALVSRAERALALLPRR
jgi:hypothetical protein